MTVEEKHEYYKQRMISLGATEVESFRPLEAMRNGSKDVDDFWFPNWSLHPSIGCTPKANNIRLFDPCCLGGRLLATLQPEDSKATYLDDDINVLLHFKDFTLPTEEERTLFEIEFGIEYPLKTDKASLKVDNSPLKADKSPLKSGG